MQTVIVPNPLEQPLLTVEEVAEIVGCCRATAYNMVTRGELPVIRVGSRIRIPTARLRREVLGLDQ